MSLSPSSNASIVQYRDSELEKESDPAVKTVIDSGIESQKTIENGLLNRKKHLMSINHEISERFADLNAAKLKEDVVNEFYDPAVMTAAMSIAQTITLPWGPTDLSRNERIREWITNLRQIGAESVSGYALLATLNSGSKVPKNGDNFFVIKAPRDPRNADELVHESVVGLYALNQMREKGIPNFALIYGSFSCSAPFIDPDTKKIVAWSNTEKMSVTYSLYESIDNDGSFDDMCENCSAETFMQYYYPVMLAIHEAYVHCGFTHYDLHTQNVINRKHSTKMFYIPYNHPSGNKIWIRADGIVPTIIDYGMSHVTIKDGGKNVELGHVGASSPLRYYGIYREKAHPLHDAYKLLCMSLASMLRHKNNKTYESLKSLLTFFNTTDLPDDIITQQLDTFYFLPLTEEIEKLTLVDYITFLDSNVDINKFSSFTRPSDVQILSCTSGNIVCTNMSSALEKVGINLSPYANVPLTFLELYDFISFHRVTDKNSPDYKRDQTICVTSLKIFNDYIIDKAVASDITRVNGIYHLLDAQPNLFFLPLQPLDLLDSSILSTSKRFISSATGWLDAYQRLELTSHIYDYFSAFTNAEFQEFKTVLQDKIKIYKKFKDTLIAHLTKQYYILYPNNNPKGYAAIKEVYGNIASKPDNAKYKWYWPTYTAILSLLP